MQYRPTIKLTITIALICVSLIDIGILSFLLARDSGRLFRNQIEKTYELAVKSFNQAIENELSRFEAETIKLSKHPLLVSSLIDELGREAYLPQLVQNFSIYGLEEMALFTFHDFNFNLLVANQKNISPADLSFVDRTQIIKQDIEP